MRQRWFASVLIIYLLNACSGASTLPRSGTAPGGAAAAKRTTVTVKVTVPGAKAAANSALRRIYSVASNTSSIVANVYATGNDTGTPLATATASIAAASANCGASDAQGNRTCSFTLTAPVGVAVDFVFDTYDGAGGTGNVIGAGTDPDQTIAIGSTPTIPVTLNSVLSTITLNAVPSVIHSIVPQTITLDVYALDADNDIIVSSGFVDPSGNTETVTVSESGTSTSPSLNSSLTFNGTSGQTTTTLSAPAPTGLQLTYNGQANDSGSPLTFAASVAPTNVTTNNATLAIAYPAFAANGTFADSNLSYTGAVHGGAAFSNVPGPSPYFVYTTQAGAIDFYKYPSSGVTQSSGGAASGYFGGSVNDTTNNTYYFVAQSGLYSVTDAGLGSLSPASACSGSCPPGNASGLGFDSSGGYLYYTSGTNLVQYSIGSGTTQTANIGVVASGGVTVDPNHNIWVVQTGANASLLMVSNAFPSPSISPITLYSNSQPYDVVTAGNGDIVVSDKEYDQLWVFSNGGSYLGTYSLPCCSNAPWYLAPDPAQPNIVWFDYASGSGQIGIGRLDINTGNIGIETYGAGPYGGQPGALAVSNNEGIVMVYDGENTLVQVQP